MAEPILQPPPATVAHAARQGPARGAKPNLLPIFLRYAGAVAAVAAATGLRLLLQGSFGTGGTFITFYPTVALVALFAGGGPGVLATILSAVAVTTWIGFGTGGAGEVIGVGLFLSSGLIVSTTAEMFRRARRREVAVLATRLSEQTREMRLLAEAVSHLGEGVVITDDELGWPGPRIRFVNEATCRITGYSADELLGRTPRVLQGRYSERDTLERMKAELASGRSFRCELINHRKDGTPYDAELFITPLFDATGRRTNFVSIHRDITERKQAEAALRDRKERLRAILNTAADAIITIDRYGIINSVNPATERMFGYAPDELSGQNVRILMPPPFCDEHDRHLAHYLETGQARIIGSGRELVGRRKDGTTFPVNLSVSEIDHLKMFTGIVRDVSSLKELQGHVLEIAADEQRRIGQELHDGTGQELTGLSLFAGTLVESLGRATPGNGEGGTAWLLEEADFLRLRRTADRLSQGLAQADRHVRELSHGIMPVQIDAEGLKSALEELASATDAQENVRCRFECSGSVRVPDNTTATHLYRIAQEALHNALRHGKADEIRIALSRHDGRIVLEVADNGVGFDPAAESSVGPARAGMGLRIMDYRAGLIGGVLRIERNMQGGMLVQCIVSQGDSSR